LSFLIVIGASETCGVYELRTSDPSLELLDDILFGPAEEILQLNLKKVVVAH